MMTKRALALFTTTLSIPALPVQSQPTAPLTLDAAALSSQYSTEQCSEWITAAISSDTIQSASGGLSQTEFMNFLSSIPQLESCFNDNLFTVSEGSVTFANLPFEVQLAYPTLACWCEELGQGEGCCEGDNPRINVSALLSDENAAYREDFCAFVSLVVEELSRPDDVTATVAATTTTATTTVAPVTTTTTTEAITTNTQAPPTNNEEMTFTIIGSVINYSNYLHNNIVPSIFDSSPPTTATDILANSESKNGVIGQLIQGFTTLSIGALRECSGEVMEKERANVLDPAAVFGSLGEISVEDIACPEGLSYAPENGSCLKFTIPMKFTQEWLEGWFGQYDEIRTCLETNINDAINNGDLYNIIEETALKDTKITGLGVPGAGVEYIGDEGDTNDGDTGGNDNDLQESGTTTERDQATASTGVPGGYIALIVIAMVLVPLTVFAVGRYRKRQAEELERVREFAGEPADETDLENPTPVVATTATAAASTPVVAPVVSPTKVKAEDHDDDESSAPSVWSESRGSHTDIVDDENANPPSPSKMGSSLAAMGVASSVATNLYEKKNAEAEEKMTEEEKLDLESIKAEIKTLVEKTAPGKTTEELLAAYAGKEEELLSHLRRLYRETSRR